MEVLGFIPSVCMGSISLCEFSLKCYFLPQSKDTETGFRSSRPCKALGVIDYGWSSRVWKVTNVKCLKLAFFLMACRGSLPVLGSSNITMLTAAVRGSFCYFVCAQTNMCFTFLTPPANPPLTLASYNYLKGLRIPNHRWIKKIYNYVVDM